MSHRQNSGKPKKPSKDFPLFPHASGQWAKKIRGKMYYFGAWADPRAAQRKYLDEREYLQAGRRPPRAQEDAITVRHVVNRFLTDKQHLLDTGEITRLTFNDYHRTASRIVDQLGRDTAVDDLQTDDFDRFAKALARTRKLVALNNEINRVRIVFKHAFDSALIEKPVRFGQMFKQPSSRAMRKHRAERRHQYGDHMFEAAEIHKILDGATQPMRSMVLLGINAGLGAADVAHLPHTALKNGWLNYPRPKTGVDRLIPLWPETLDAIDEANSQRTDKRLVFVTVKGGPYSRVAKNGSVRNSCTEQFIQLLQRLKMKRPRMGFYWLRHTFETVAGETTDQVAVDSMMGHVDNSMGENYRERIGRDRLKKVTDHVHAWLYGE